MKKGIIQEHKGALQTELINSIKNSVEGLKTKMQKSL